MNQDYQLLQQDVEDNRRSANVQKGKLDLIILKYMARRLHLTLRQLDQPTSFSQPLLYRLRERHGHTHRIALYNHQELFLQQTLPFIGFISRKQMDLSRSVIDEIQAVDKLLIEELVNNPGILSYSSLELRNGNWCNLVIMRGADAKAHMKSTKTHMYPAHQLAYGHYEWIRLHHGIMTEGLDHMEMVLQKTKYYTFHSAEQKPVIREHMYGRASKLSLLPYRQRRIRARVHSSVFGQ
jgi:hypothetical protein